MDWLTGVIVAGVTSFVATNIDDILILTIFFSQVSDTFRPQHIIAGQYLGFSLILLASLPGYFGGLILPKPWISLLGFIPIIIGLTKLFKRENSGQEVQDVSLDLSSPTGTSLNSTLSHF